MATDARDALVISVPCAACETPIVFGDRVCSACKAIVSPRKQQVLERRLEAASPDFRALKGNVQAAAVILLVLAIAHLAFGAVLYYMATDRTLIAPSAAELAGARFDLACNLFVAVTMGGCFVWARTAPASALFTAAVLWFAAQVAVVGYGGVEALGLGSIKTLTAKIVTLALLVRGIGAAVSATRMRARLAAARTVRT